MVDEVRVTRLLRAIDAGVASLQRRQGDDATSRASETWLMAVKYGFITTIEACVDIAQHICAVDHLGVPASNAEALRALGRAGIVETDLAGRLAHAVGFRNVLVHEYIDVDDSIVIERLTDLSDLTMYVSQIARYVDSGT